MNKPIRQVTTPATHKVCTPRAEAVRELETEITGLFGGCERALLMAEDLVDEYFCPLCEEVDRKNREACILFYFEQNRIRAQILHDILFKLHATAESLDAELRKAAKGE